MQIKLLKDAGAIVMAKTNMAEWAFAPDVSIGSTFGVVRNPYDLDRSTAGSSGGTAAGKLQSFVHSKGPLGLCGKQSEYPDLGTSVHRACTVGSAFSLVLHLRTGFVHRSYYLPYNTTDCNTGKTFTMRYNYCTSCQTEAILYTLSKLIVARHSPDRAITGGLE